MGEEILLVTDEDRVALAAARSLGRAGYSVALATSEPRTLATASRFVARLVSLPDPLAGPPEEFGAAVARVARAAPPALLIGAGDLALAALAPLRTELERVTRIALPSAPLLATCFDRSVLLARAEAAGLLVPAHRQFGDYAEAQKVAVEVDFPAVVRPVARVQWERGGRGARRLGLVAASRSAFLSAAEEMLALGAAVAEEPLAGERIGLCLLFARGGPVLACQHRALHEMDGRRGTASYREMMAVDPALRSAAEGFFAPLGATGLVQIAFRVQEGRVVFLDAGCGPDESLALAALAGIDFLRALVEFELPAVPGGTGGAAGAPGAVRIGTRMRHLASDLGWQRARGGAGLARALPGALAAGGRWLSGREGFEEVAGDDLGPAVRAGGELGRRTLKVLTRASARLGARVEHLVAGAPHETRARRILVLCDGNICRSPFVEHRLRMQIAAAGAGGAITVESAGLRAALGHPAPPLARAAAARFDVDLTPHRSRPTSAELVAAADLVLVMDLDQRARFAEAYPEAGARVMLMARFDPLRSGAPEVPDPVFGDAATFDRVYERLRRATDRLATALSAALPGVRPGSRG